MLTLVYILIVLSVFLEFSLSSFFDGNLSTGRKVVAVTPVLLNTFTVSSLITIRFDIWSVLLSVLSIFRIVNVARIMRNKMNAKELKQRALRSSVVLGMFTHLMLAGYIIGGDHKFTNTTLMYLAIFQLIAATILFTSVLITRTIYRYHIKKTIHEKLPTVTVCIPARNETNDLPGCIESVLASLYPKLEILVLDDCSHDKTPDIIKKYAHSGVRFIKGKIPADDWLAKNSAYDRLTNEAKSEVIIFLGVDVRLQPDSINEILTQMGECNMLSILPSRGVETEGSLFIQPIRYWWELGLWRFSMARPPVLSTCWAVRRDALISIGGFEGVKKSVKPESVFATEFKSKGKYRFVVSNKIIAVSSIKKPKMQYNTALRTRYVQLSRQPESVFNVLLFEGFFILGPYLLGLWAIVNNLSNIAILSLISVVLLSLANAGVYKLVLRYLWPAGFVTLPLLAVADWILMIKSMYSYEFNKVIWKERNICIPLLSVESSLPKLD